MKDRNTAGKLGFIKDAEGVYRKGNFIFKNGKIIRESQIVPEGTIKDLKDDDFITLDECIRSILAYSTTIGDINNRATNVYVDKVGNSYKPAKKLSKNTVAVVMSNRQVMELKPRDIVDQDDNTKLENKDKEDKPVKAKTIKDFSKPTEFDKLKKESAGKKQFIVKTKNYESDPITANSESEALETFAAQDDGDYSKFFVATPVGDIKESATKKVGKLKLKESTDYPKLESELMGVIADYLSGIEGVSNISTYEDMELNRVCKYTYDGNTFVVRVDEID